MVKYIDCLHSFQIARKVSGKSGQSVTYTVSFLVNQTVLGIYIPYCKSVPDFHKNFPDSDATTLPCPHPSDKEGHFSGITKQTVCLPFFVPISCPGPLHSAFTRYQTRPGQTHIFTIGIKMMILDIISFSAVNLYLKKLSFVFANIGATPRCNPCQ